MRSNDRRLRISLVLVAFAAIAFVDGRPHPAIQDVARGGPTAPTDRLACAPEFITAASRAWRRSGIGMTKHEAGFWVYDVNGQTRYLDLPLTNEDGEITLSSMPPNPTAVFHTHPNNKSPQPSPNDIAAADRLNVTVYTGTKQGLWAHDPGSAESYLVRPGLTWTTPCKDSSASPPSF